MSYVCWGAGKILTSWERNRAEEPHRDSELQSLLESGVLHRGSRLRAACMVNEAGSLMVWVKKWGQGSEGSETAESGFCAGAA